VWSAINQSLRGAIARIAGRDLTSLWLVFAAAAAAFGTWVTWVCLRAGDRAAALLAVQFTGLLISPISWSHHWVWVLPLLIWCLFGPQQRLVWVRLLAVAWVIATCSYIVSILIAQQFIGQLASRHWWQAWLGSVYPVLGVLTLVLLLVVNRRLRADPAGHKSAVAAPPDSGLAAAS
jgi:alpha-1,2-mannosyltransferase